ncbi:MAG TPA: hypothetical protein DCQ06_03930 [Myxococcales bacterium]|nr:hypothetical protein [Myxococcales bacterium]HAN30723.1 hypothetical protein [Myxococcales bacterium]|tara:strand:- start:208 stop:726 length:519 start_codon:yes stop_codon:yes gene_type:complete
MSASAPWTIRRAERLDAQALVDFKAQVLKETEFLLQGVEDFTGHKVDEIQIIEAFTRHQGSSLLLAIEDNEIVAMCTVVAGAFVRSRHVGQTGIAVLQSHWGRGVAAALIRRALRDAAAQGLKKLSLQVHADNHRARRFYQNHGFQYEGRLRAEALLAGNLVDLLAMGRILE